MSNIEDLKKLLAEGAITQEEYESLLPTIKDENPTSAENVTKPESESEPDSEIKPARETEPVAEARPVSEAQPVPEAKPASEAQPGPEAKPESEVKPDDESGEFDYEKEYQEIILHATRSGRKMQKAVNSQILVFLFNLIGLILLFQLVFDQIFSALMSQGYWSDNLEDDPSLAIATGSFFFLGFIFWIRYLSMLYTAGSKLRGLGDE